MKYLVLSLLALLTILSASFAQNLDEIEIVNTFLDPWEEALEISTTINGDTTYLAVATGVSGARVYRVLPDMTTELVYNFNEMPAYGVHFQSDALYISAGDDGLYYYFGVPYQLSSDYLYHVELDGFCQAAHTSYGVDLLFVAAGEAGMHIVDISSITEPELVGTFSYANGNDAADVDGWGNYAMLANGEYGLFIIDVNNPSSPTMLDRYSIETYEVVCNGSAERAYYVSANQPTYNRLYWLNLTDLENIDVYSNIAFNGIDVTGIEASGFIGYATTSEGQFFKFWADNQQNLVKQDSLTFGENPATVTIGAGSKIFVLDQTHGIYNVDVSNAPDYVANEIIESDGSVNFVNGTGNIAIVSASWGGLHTVDMTDPENPQRLAHFCQDTEVYRTFVYGDLIFVNAYPNILCYDISDPANPVFMDEVTFDGGSKWVIPAVVDNKLVYKPNQYVVRVRDVSDPTNIGEYVDITLPNDAHVGNLFTDDEYVYINNPDDENTHIYDFSDLENITEVGTIASGYTTVLRRQGDVLYLLASLDTSTLKTFDISNPASPSLLGETTFQGMTTWGALLYGGYYIVPIQLTNKRVEVFDVSDPVNPVSVTSFASDRNRSAAAFDHYIVTGDVAGMVIWNASEYLEVISEEIAKTPSTFEIASIYPNPFNPSATITIDSQVASKMIVTIYDIQGRQVATLFDGQMSAGSHNLHFDGSNLASGSYFVKAVAPGQGHRLQRMTLVK